LGFPTGITGMALMARAYNQAQKFGVEMAIPDEVIGLDPASYPYDGRFILNLSKGERAGALGLCRTRALPTPHRGKS
jgi:thioredoxin reductase (NADPH)